MDSITQAVLGASITGCTLGRFHGRKAVLAGAVLATLPDLDVLLSYADPITAMTSHRGFSHSVFVLTGFAVLLTMAWRMFRPNPRYSWLRLFLAIWLALVTHPILDAFTSYGTQLLWPFTPIPQSWASIFIVDPAYTVPLLIATLIGLIAGARPVTTKACAWALGLSTAYLLSTVGVQYYVDQQARRFIQQKGHQVSDSFTTPQLFSMLLWRSVIRTNDGVDCELIYGLLDQADPEYLCLANNLHLGANLDNAKALQSLQWFSGNWLRYDVIDDLLVVSDLRMGTGAGHYSFRFVVAEQNADQQWELVVPYRWPRELNKAILLTTLKRSTQQEPALPLAEWAQQNRLTQHTYTFTR